MKNENEFQKEVKNKIYSAFNSIDDALVELNDANEINKVIDKIIYYCMKLKR